MSELKLISGDDVVMVINHYKEDFTYFDCGKNYHKIIIDPDNITRNASGIAAALNEKVIEIAVENIKLKTIQEAWEKIQNSETKEMNAKK